MVEHGHVSDAAFPNLPTDYYLYFNEFIMTVIVVVTNNMLNPGLKY